MEDTMKEIDILKKCRHDNIVSLYGCLQNDDQVCLVYPRMQGWLTLVFLVSYGF